MQRCATTSTPRAKGAPPLPDRTFAALLVETGRDRAGGSAVRDRLAVRLESLRRAGAEVIEVGSAGEEDLGPAVSALADLGITGELILLVVDTASQLPPLDGLSRVTVWRRSDGAEQALGDLLETQLQRRRQGRVPGVDRDPRWTVRLPEGEGSARLAESLGALSNGRAGVRAQLEEHAGRDPAPFLVGGVYDPDDRLLAGPVWTGVDLTGEPAPERTERLVDLRGGILWRHPAGRRGVRSLRFVSAAHPHVMGLRIEADGADLPAQPALRPPGPPDQVGYRHWAETSSGVELAVTGHTGDAPGEGGAIVVAARQHPSVFEEGQALERIAVWDASGDPSPGSAVRAGIASAGEIGFDGLLAAHRAAWAARWKRVGVWIEGSPTDELAARLAIFHLIGAAAEGGESAVGPRGLTGAAYAGHVFWDADVFVLPALAAISPAAARSMLQYRINRLPAARRSAAEAGRRGARFPWESARDGTDVTPPWVRNGVGELVPIRTGRHEIHIVADVAWSAWRYAGWTGDEAFLSHGEGGDLLAETARYWASRIRLDRRGRGHLYGVMGPDEYHQVVDDNAFTNVMARWNLRTAARLSGGTAAAPAEAGEAGTWRALASRLVDGWDPQRKIFEQFAGYYGLERLMVRDFAEAPVAADLVLPPERVAGSQLIKQADALMLYHMVPDEVPPGSLGATLDFYGPRTAHGSSLSPAIHASLLARAGRTEEALRMFRLAARLDLDDVTGTTSGGLHLATMGGVWQALAHGFLGLSARAGTLLVDPHLPADWSALRLRFSFRGASVEVEADHREVAVRCDAPIEVGLPAGRPVRVGPPGRTWPLTDGGGRPARDVGPCSPADRAGEP